MSSDARLRICELLNNELRAQQAMFLSARDEFKTRQADTLANSWAVFEHSMANMKSPAGANNSQENKSEARRDEILAQAQAAFEYSQLNANMRSGANMKSPSGANSPQENRSGENEMRIDCNGEENRRGASGNALIDGASVPLVYLPSWAGKEYHMS